MKIKIVVSIFCMLVITAGFSFDVLAEQNKKNLISEPEILNSETVIFEVSHGNDNSDIISSLSFLDTLDQQQTLDSNYAFAVTGNGAFAQGFIPTLNQLTRVELKIYKKGNVDGLKISIRSHLVNPDLTSKYIAATSIPTNKTWYEFDFPDISLTPGNTYYIVFDPEGVQDHDNNIYWSFGLNNPYTNGRAHVYLNASWSIFNPSNFSNPDFCFKTYGNQNIPPNKPTTPSGPTTGDTHASLHYESIISDPDGDNMEVYFDWSDGTNTGWVGLSTNGTVGNDKTWNTAGTYQIRVKTRDTPYLTESPWSDPLNVTISEKPFGGITSPVPGYFYLFGDQLFPLKSGKTIFLFGGIPVTANFTAEGAPIKTVQFYLDDVLINEDTTAPYSVTLSTKHSGPATIKVTAIDILGHSASDTLNIDYYLKLL